MAKKYLYKKNQLLLVKKNILKKELKKATNHLII